MDHRSVGFGMSGKYMPQSGAGGTINNVYNEITGTIESESILTGSITTKYNTIGNISI